MIALNIPSEDNEARSLPRTRLYLAATIRFEQVSAAIRLRDLSASGARIDGAMLPLVGASAHIARGALYANGTIIWRDRKSCGFLFDEPLSVDAWMPPRLHRDQQAVDEIADLLKSGASMVPLRSPVVPVNELRNALPQRLAEELAYVGRLLESLGDDLCNEPLVVARHAEKLQNLDIASQILGHVAAIIVAEQPEQAVKAIGMIGLRKRLERVAL